MYKCPKCGNLNPRETRQCPLMARQAVCIRCCQECNYYEPDPATMWVCTYYIHNHHRYHAPEEGQDAHALVDQCRDIIGRRQDET